MTTAVPDSPRITVDIVGDSGTFGHTGKSIAYLLRVGESTLLIDCGAPVLGLLGHEGIEKLKCVFVTHSHWDHCRWITDLALYTKYTPAIGRPLALATTEAIHEEFQEAGSGAMLRSLNAERNKVVDLAYDLFVKKVLIGPKPRYRIAAVGSESQDCSCLRILDADTGEVVPPDMAKVFVSPASGRNRMLFRDAESGMWVEPISYYAFSSRRFYHEEQRDFVDEDSGLRIRAVNAPVWHGPPTIGLLCELGDTRLAFSSDTVFDPELWKRLTGETRKIRRTPEFEKAYVIRGDINEYIERTWSEERLEEALSAFGGAMLFHDADAGGAVVHTAYGDIERTGNRGRMILVHTPDNFVSRYPIAMRGRRIVVAGKEMHEEVGGELSALNADIYVREGEEAYVGFEDEAGDAWLWSTASGLAMTREDSPPAPDAAFHGRCKLYADVAGRYVEPPEGADECLVLRPDGQVELVKRSDRGSTGRIVPDLRKEISRRRAAKARE